MEARLLIGDQTERVPVPVCPSASPSDHSLRDAYREAGGQPDGMRQKRRSSEPVTASPRRIAGLRRPASFRCWRFAGIRMPAVSRALLSPHRTSAWADTEGGYGVLRTRRLLGLGAGLRHVLHEQHNDAAGACADRERERQPAPHRCPARSVALRDWAHPGLQTTAQLSGQSLIRCVSQLAICRSCPKLHLGQK